MRSYEGINNHFQTGTTQGSIAKLAETMRTMRDSSVLNDDAASMFYAACDVLAQEHFAFDQYEHEIFMQMCGAAVPVRCQVCNSTFPGRLQDAILLTMDEDDTALGYCGCEDEERYLAEFCEGPR